MALATRKRVRPLPAAGPTGDAVGALKFPDIGLFLVERKMGSSRRGFLTALARRKGFRVEEIYSDAVTHVIAEQNSGAEVMQWLEKQPGRREEGISPTLLHVGWFTECMAAGVPVRIEPRHLLERPQVQLHPDLDVAVVPLVASYACQRRTPLTNKNRIFTDALETLAEEAAFSGSEGRSLAFTKAASVLKSLPSPLTTIEELSRLPGFGKHSKRVIQEILEDGTSTEVERVMQKERYQTMKLFTNIFGVGVKTADNWYQEGLRSLGDLRKHQKKLTQEQEAGLQHYEDLNTPVSRREADVIAKMIEEATCRFLPETVVKLTGGFRRGKPFGHDVDILITHPQEGSEEGLLIKLISWLQSQGLILYHDLKKNSYQDHPSQRSVSTSAMDHFERCFSIFRLKGQSWSKGDGGAGTHSTDLARDPGAFRDWKAVRVDLIVAPMSQYPYALLGWTGSKHFERELRRFSFHEKKMVLNSHALYDTVQQTFLVASREEDIFAHLGLEFVPPSDRNA
ncbi:DNA-directed DNA/RNA polymerase mu [Rhinatrema bivittatum]|uniref:DNA-directed DNA/RNA polymerase mu n=1 Tax=Rhinatrema bivittatum TaxID=194408 RepID=UPI00112ACE1A|nr:DNA-directed DNA/RNA polymerase mu [Rhinatrema bivittatum]